MKRIYARCILVLLLMSLLVLPILVAEKEAMADQAAVQKTGINSILEPAKGYTAKLSGYLPKLGGLLLILVVGFLIAVAVALLVGEGLKFIQLEKGAKQIKINEVLKNGGIALSLSELITEIIFFLIVIATLITALEFCGLATNAIIASVLSYLPQVLAAVFVLILGILLAVFISGIITLVGGNVRIAQAGLLANTAKYAIIVISILIAAKELGLGIILSDKSKDIILGGLVLGLVIAFGFGAKEKAEKFLNNIFKEQNPKKERG